MPETSLQSSAQALRVAYFLFPEGYIQPAVAGVLPLVRAAHVLKQLGFDDIVGVGDADRIVGVTNARWLSFEAWRQEAASLVGPALVFRGDVFLVPSAIEHFVEAVRGRQQSLSAIAVENQRAVPIGMFYLPELTRLASAPSLDALFSDLGGQITEGFTVDDSEWQALHGLGHRLAERKLTVAVGATPSTFLGRIFAYPISRRLARQFARMQVSVDVVQIVAALILLTSAVLLLPFDVNLPLAGGLFLLATLFDHAARDLAVLTFRESYKRSMALTLVRYLGFSAFFAALGVNTYYNAGPRFYVFAGLVSFCAWGYLTILMARFASRDGGELAPLLDATNLAEIRGKSRSWWERALFSLDWLVRAESFPVLVAAFCFLGFTGPLFWLSSAALLGAIVSILRLLSSEQGAVAKAISKSAATFLFYMVGLTILAILVGRMPLGSVQEAVMSLGTGILWTLFLPLTWALPYAGALWILLNRKVAYRDCLYTQVAGDAFNNVIPLMGLGGEPFKAKHLSNFVPVQDASRAIVQSRLVHALSGVLFTAMVLAVTIVVVDLDHRFAYALGAVTALMLAATGAILWVTMSRMPSRATGFVLTKLKIVSDFRDDRMTWRQLYGTMALKIVGRGFKFFELYVIFWALSMTPKFADVVLVEAMIMASASLFFVVPQGLGVNELGIATAFEMAGLGVTAGLAYGLTRRARVVAYAVIGLVVYLLGTVFKIGKNRYRPRELAN